MTIQEFVKIAINGFPKEEFDRYRPFFLDMTCEHCIYNGFACKDPKADGVCIDYRVEMKNNERRCGRTTK